MVAKLRSLRMEFAEIGRQLEDPEVAADHRKARSLAVRRAGLEGIATRVERLETLDKEATEYRSLVGGGDRDLAEMAKEDLPRVEREAAEVYEGLTGELVQADDNKVGSVMLEVRAGTGGDEAGIWAGDILEMYRKYAAKAGWTWEVLEMTPGDAGGVRSAVVNVRGAGVWTAMNFEAGVHSVKRVPATEAQGRIHTSTATVAVLPEPEDVEVKIDWANDVEEFATTSQGPGGQNVNKVATAVQIKHKPTGIIIRMMESKSQQQNRERARRLLMTRLHEAERQRLHAERSSARAGQIGGGERSEKTRTYRYKEGIAADERLSGEYALRDLLAGDFSALHGDLIRQEVQRRLAAL
ncbi:MAG: PCRF domain-containing protein [Phycisphaerales bacterium]